MKWRQWKRWERSWTGFGRHFVPIPMALFLRSFSFSGFLTSMKSELRNRSSEYSDISDSEDSGPDCTALVCLGPCNLELCDGKMNTHFPLCGRKVDDSFPKACLSDLCGTEPSLQWWLHTHPVMWLLTSDQQSFCLILERIEGDTALLFLIFPHRLYFILR